MELDLNILNYAPSLKMMEVDGQKKVFDVIRRKWLVITPEELVRQALIQYLIQERIYPKSSIQVEKSIILHDQLKRFDVVIYTKKADPFLLIECKSFKVAINQDVVDQAARYNFVIGAPYLLVTNGMKSFCACLEEKSEISFMNTLPMRP